MESNQQARARTRRAMGAGEICFRRRRFCFLRAKALCTANSISGGGTMDATEGIIMAANADAYAALLLSWMLLLLLLL